MLDVKIEDIEVGDEFEVALAPNEKLRISSVDRFDRTFGVVRTKEGENIFNYEIMLFSDFQKMLDFGAVYPVHATKNDICFHVWDLYIGLTKRYKFCNKCGYKQGDMI